ncbi:cytochrome c oxidase subunit 3 [Halapricum hydrolyticum]|uniref:Heme-copper oxidase subunit III n=1 Tax=Halapricum hydrolyticum TaxID=2979991 RepID=A0AAE3LID9_9EURY|nr:heme-copper oxidase subunit III [Halapricum hydrolyticum]MCU4717256.1 heme-copper oxidase subunit III [Halapricum hydrolyticum]MCU4726183.1 heme-copper oxidase subunit III [Halapricum hydrolyticum]
MSTADSEDHGGHHLPAVEDWPRGFGEASWWPFVTAVGGALIYIGVALVIWSSSSNPTLTTVGEQAVTLRVAAGGVLAASVLLLLAGIYGWLYHAFVATYWEHGTEQRSSSSLRFGMVLFLGSEIATFGAGFVYYFFIRSGAWSTDGFPELLGSLVLINTAILLTSSVTLHFSHVALRNGNRQRYVRLLGLTLLLGVVFIAGQAYEYYEFIVHEGFTIQGGAFNSAFYGLTGLHGAHVSLGAILLGIIFARSLMGQYTPDRHTSVSTVSMYWHFVDLVWVFLVVSLYLGAVL